MTLVFDGIVMKPHPASKPQGEGYRTYGPPGFDAGSLTEHGGLNGPDDCSLRVDATCELVRRVGATAAALLSVPVVSFMYGSIAGLLLSNLFPGLTYTKSPRMLGGINFMSRRANAR